MKNNFWVYGHFKKPQLCLYCTVEHSGLSINPIKRCKFLVLTTFFIPLFMVKTKVLYAIPDNNARRSNLSQCTYYNLAPVVVPQSVSWPKCTQLLEDLYTSVLYLTQVCNLPNEQCHISNALEDQRTHIHWICLHFHPSSKTSHLE